MQAAPLLSLRSGNPHGVASAAFAVPLAPGVTVERVSFAYRYDTGFGPTGVGANFTLFVGGSAVYASPQYTDYQYGHNRSNYSSPVAVDVATLDITVPADARAAASRLEFRFQNNDRNVQLLLPLSVHMVCSGAGVAIEQ